MLSNIPGEGVRPGYVRLIHIEETTESIDFVGDGRVEHAMERDDLTLEGLAVVGDGVAFNMKFTNCFRHGDIDMSNVNSIE
jgi:hypothetical protein